MLEKTARTRWAHAWFILPFTLAAILSGCGTRASSTVTDASPPPGNGAWTFVADDDGGAPRAVALRMDSIANDEATLSVVARGMDKLQGLAFRLGWDAQRLELSKPEVGSGWYGAGVDVVSRFATKPGGELWAGIGYAGSHGLDAVREVTLARFQVKLSGQEPIPLVFRENRNVVITPEATSLSVTWSGGTFRRQ
jgi:hypothetical protein